jgi:DNA-binding NarL/FixJ family response regulator
MSDPIRVVIIEDQWMIRDGLTALAQIGNNIEVVATGVNGNEALALAAEHSPDVILMDIKMPNLDGLEATRRIKQSQPNIHILVLTTFEEDHLIQKALAVGAAGYLTKDIAAEDLADAISTAAKGIIQLTPNVASRLVSSSATTRSTNPDMQATIDHLTPRERDVLRLLATGASNPDIAKALDLSTGTVKNHVSAILRQLGITDRTQAAVIATQHTETT